MSVATRHGVAAAALALALCACSSGAVQSPSALPATATPIPLEQTPAPTPEPALTFAAIDACAILDQQAAEKVAMTPLETGQPGNPRSPSCLYAGPISGPTAQVQIFVGDGAKKTYDIDVQLNHEFVALPDIGDEAYLEPNAVFIRKGGTWVAIELVRLNDPKENAQPLLEAAKTVASRLP